MKWRINNYVPRQGNVWMRELKVLGFKNLVLILLTSNKNFSIPTDNVYRMFYFSQVKTTSKMKSTQSWKLFNYFLLQMTAVRNERKLSAVNRDSQKEHPRNYLSRDTNAPGVNEENFTHVSQEIEARVTKKLSQELGRTESRTLGALSKVDEFHLNS